VVSNGCNCLGDFRQRPSSGVLFCSVIDNHCLRHILVCDIPDYKSKLMRPLWAVATAIEAEIKKAPEAGAFLTHIQHLTAGYRSGLTGQLYKPNRGKSPLRMEI
jgi:hypothetical protein